MQHHVARSLPGTLLCADAAEACALWARVARVPALQAACVMPNHVHVLAERDVKAELGQAMSGFVRWRHARRGTRGRLLADSPDGQEVHGDRKVQRQIRYVHLNPCRAGLVDDPVAWPWSTHLDALGLAWRPARAPDRDPWRLHRYVSADPSCRADGTDLPCPPAGLLGLEQVVDGVSASLRCTSEDLRRRGPARDLLLSSLRGLTDATAPTIAAFAGVGVRTVHRARPLAHDGIAALAADGRLRGWEGRLEGVLARSRRWAARQSA